MTYEIPAPGIFVKKNAISEQNVDNLVAFFKQNKKLQMPGMCGMTTVDPKIKKSTDIIINAASKQKDQQFVVSQLNDCLSDGMEEYVKEYPILETGQMWRMEPLAILQSYKPKEGFFKLHYESINENLAGRMIVWMIYLNDCPDGGTEFPYFNLTTKAEKGTLVLFPTSFTYAHKGQISEEHPKMIATGWYSMVPYHIQEQMMQQQQA
jgi:hypothetical protein